MEEIRRYKIVDKKTHGKIISALRKLTFAYPPRNAVKNATKVGPAAYKCELCKDVVYEGRKELEKTGLLDNYPSARKGKMNIDHKLPTIPIKGFKNVEWDWNEYLENMFCEEEGLQSICSECHKAKNKEEAAERAAYRRSKK